MINRGKIYELKQVIEELSHVGYLNCKNNTNLCEITSNKTMVDSNLIVVILDNSRLIDEYINRNIQTLINLAYYLDEKVNDY
jgi:hypothetical protein